MKKLHRLRTRQRHFFFSSGGQGTLSALGVLLFLVFVALILGAVAEGIWHKGTRQNAVDLAALAGVKAMHGVYSRLFEPAFIEGQPNPSHLERAQYLVIGRRAAIANAKKNGLEAVNVTFPDEDKMAPVRIRVAVDEKLHVRGRAVKLHAFAEAELAPPSEMPSFAGPGGGDEYKGPFAYRQGKPMRPDVALAFDRLSAAAKAAGYSLTINSAYRSNAEQAVLFARHPDPRWVARPGQSLHRLGTELDLGPSTAHEWLAKNASFFHFTKRYSWEPWHFGYTLNAGSRSVGYGGASGQADGERSHVMPSFVPARFAQPIAQAAQRWNVSAALLAAQLYAESNFNPFARSSAGAMGIAQFTPGTAAAYGLDNPYDPVASINAQAHLMRDLLRQFGSVVLALAAYNAGPGPVTRCHCIPPYPETQGYVARILGLLGGAGDIPAGGGLIVRLIG